MPPKEWPTERIRLDKVDPNPWNPNRMTQEAVGKLRRAVEDEGLGILGHIVVRPKGKRWELVDGEHRLEVYREMGLEDVEAIVADLSDENAQVAGLLLNELRGRPSLPELGKILGGLAASRSIAALANVLPWREAVIDNLARTYGGYDGAPDKETPPPPAPLPQDAKILHGDARLVLEDLEADFVQCVVTSPPYWALRDYARCECAVARLFEGQSGELEGEGGARNYRETAPDPDCPKCHGSGRDDSLDVVWDGDPACEHDWGTKVPARGRSNWNTLGDYLFPGQQAGVWKQALGVEVTHGRFCQICAAWEGQLGLEPFPDLYVAHLVHLFRAVRHVLRDDGTVWLNLGDSYFGDSPVRAASSEQFDPAKQAVLKRSAGGIRRSAKSIGGLKTKDLVGMPWRVAFALQADGWWVRKNIIWNKPNHMPESATDRPTSSHEDVFLLAKSKTYFYDQDAVRESSQSGPSDVRKMIEKKARIGGMIKVQTDPLLKASALTNIGRKRAVGDPSGRNLRDVWTIASGSFPEAHFATFPEALAAICVKAGSRIGDVVLDPFCGSGTAGIAALRLGRKFIGIEIKETFVEMAERRIGKALQAPA